MDSSIATFRPRSFKLVSPVTIPAFTGVRLRPPSAPACADVESLAQAKVMGSPSLRALPSGARVAVAVGSRGIDRLPLLVRGCITALRGMGLTPFIVPAMGSHGGADAEGQRMLLHHLGVTEESVGAPVVSSMETVDLGCVAPGVNCHISRDAFEADAIMTVVRVKAHTNFTSDIESGLCKMLTVGLGKDLGAKNAHIYGRKGLVEYIPRLAEQMIAHAPVAFGLAVVENAESRICLVEGVEAADMLKADRELLARAKKLKAVLPFEQLDMLVVEEIGKDISGTGMDSKVVGRVGFGEPYGHPFINTIAVLRVTAASGGNGIGIGIADVTTTETINGLDLEAMWINALTSCCMDRVKLPPAFASEREAIQAGLKICWQPRTEFVRAAVIRSTRDLGHILLTRPCWKNCARRIPGCWTASGRKKARLSSTARGIWIFPGLKPDRPLLPPVPPPHRIPAPASRSGRQSSFSRASRCISSPHPHRAGPEPSAGYETAPEHLFRGRTSFMVIRRGRFPPFVTGSPCCWLHASYARLPPAHRH